MCIYTYISRNLFFGERVDPQTSIGRCTYVCICVCRYTEADCGRKRRRRIYLRQGKVGSTEPATKVRARCWILDIFGVPVRICGCLEFTASEQQTR